ncbi:Transmembrane protein [Parasponia andersonii]|uniref:Transmembrane protein n=1 Tax=Parasponia andersonii TaxID=3476 RepID=A0A2P5C2D8_PARAD|nr:Transmembrane protein [Parasponia andersonii]
MAVPSNKSSSSSPISGRANPNARSSEIGNPMRRSFTGNPFSKPSVVLNPRGLNPNTPANSPSEHPRRSSMSRETIVTFRDNDDKENGKVARIRSPIGSKGTKNFMSPTISAASKITPSPRKKILEERNEPVRASVSFSDLKIESFGQPIADSEHKKECSNIEPVLDSKEEPLSSKKESDSIPKIVFVEPQCFNNVVIEEPDLVTLDPTFKISPPPNPPPPLPACPSSVPIIAPLDSDPLAPPYNPKTNYLSPRPQFLHYKPNPRVELYLSKTREGKRLEDSFISGTVSDTDITTEEETQSQKDLEDVSSSESAKEEEKEQVEEEELIVSEPSPIDVLTSEKEIVQAKRAPKPRSVRRSKLTSLLIVLSFAALAISITNSPVIDHSVFDSSTLFEQYDHSEVIAFTKTRFDELAQNFGVWYADCLSFFYELISNLRGAHKLGPLKYCNLTYDGYVGTPGQQETNVFVASRGREVHIEPLEENGQTDIGDADSVVENEEQVYLAESIVEAPEIGIEAEYEEQVYLAESIVESPEMNIEAEYEEQVYLAESIVEAPEMNIEAEYEEQVYPAAESRHVNIEETSEEHHHNSDSQELHQAPKVEVVKPECSALGEQSQEEDNLSGDLQDERVMISSLADVVQPEVSTANMLGMALLVALALIASTVFIFVKRGSNNSTSNVVNANSVTQVFVTKKLDSTPILSAIPDDTFEVRPSSWNYSGDSCPSEVSSFENTSSYNKKRLNEAHSYERRKGTKNNHRRESMASSSMDSSMGSPSYGSFTTYEKIPTKSGYGDEEIITPVRRSSRLRSQVTSP